MVDIQIAFHWFTDHPLGAATLLYSAGVLGILIYAYHEAYFEPRNQP